jgi:hypothetical protein
MLPTLPVVVITLRVMLQNVPHGYYPQEEHHAERDDYFDLTGAAITRSVMITSTLP